MGSASGRRQEALPHEPGDVQRLKLILLLQVLRRETDEEHGMSAPDLVAALGRLGVKVERKTLYRDLEALRALGYDIRMENYPRARYKLVGREFDGVELGLLADAVQSSRFITQEMSQRLVESVGRLGSRYQADELSRRIHVEGRVRTQNESVFSNVDVINRAMHQCRKVRFYYLKYNEHVRPVRQRDGKPYLETPVALIYSEDCYYLVAWNDKHESFTNYRVDRMEAPTVSHEQAVVNEEILTFDPAAYQRPKFGMYNGEQVAAVLRVHSSVMSSVVDQFGVEVPHAAADDDGWARVSVQVVQSPTFFGWLARFDTRVQVESPASLRAAYLDYLGTIADVYRRVDEEGAGDYGDQGVAQPPADALPPQAGGAPPQPEGAGDAGPDVAPGPENG